MPTNNVQRENLGPAEKIIDLLVSYEDHYYHGRPGIVVPDNSTVGVKWFPVTHKEVEGEGTVVYKCSKRGNRIFKTKIGLLQPDMSVVDNGRKVGEYRKPGLFPEVVAYVYKQIGEIWKLDNEFVARWASYAFSQKYKDLKAILAAFLLVQERKGEPIFDGEEVSFFDDDFRDVGEAMFLIKENGHRQLDPKFLVRIHNILTLPQVIEINRELGFGHSARKVFLGRWGKVVRKWLRYREENLPMLNGLIKSGYRTTVIALAQRSQYKPISSKFFELLRWKQKQAKDGRRNLAIGQELVKAESWEGLTEERICQKIIQDKPNYKRIISLVPTNIGLTRAVVAAAIEAGSFSNKDLVIHTPTLEELGLLNVKGIRLKWEQALKAAEDMRAANIASRVRDKKTKEKLQEASDEALQKEVKEDLENIRVYFCIDKSGSMEQAIDVAIEYCSKFVQAFPLDRLHTCIFDAVGREIKIKKASAAGVKHALSGIAAGGGTDYGAAVKCLQKYQPKENEDAIFIFIGDEGANDFHTAVQNSGINPVAFGLIKVVNSRWPQVRFAVQNTANRLGIPCFHIKEDTFSDPYAIPRVIKNLIASTPVGQTPGRTTPRVSLIDTILNTPLLEKPTWVQI